MPPCLAHSECCTRGCQELQGDNAGHKTVQEGGGEHQEPSSSLEHPTAGEQLENSSLCIIQKKNLWCRGWRAEHGSCQAMQGMQCWPWGALQAEPHRSAWALLGCPCSACITAQVMDAPIKTQPEHLSLWLAEDPHLSDTLHCSVFVLSSPHAQFSVPDSKADVLD